MYTVSAGQTAILKEIMFLARGSNASVTIGLFVLRSGGTTYPTGNSNAASDGGGSAALANVGQAVALNTALASNSTTYQVTARNTVLTAGDTIVMRIANGTAGNIDATTFGGNIWISGDVA